MALNSKFVGHSSEIVWQSKIKGSLSTFLSKLHNNLYHMKMALPFLLNAQTKNWQSVQYIHPETIKSPRLLIRPLIFELRFIMNNSVRSDVCAHPEKNSHSILPNELLLWGNKFVEWILPLFEIACNLTKKSETVGTIFVKRHNQFVSKLSLQ